MDWSHPSGRKSTASMVVSILRQLGELLDKPVDVVPVKYIVIIIVKITIMITIVVHMMMMMMIIQSRPLYLLLQESRMHPIRCVLIQSCRHLYKCEEGVKYCIFPI